MSKSITIPTKISEAPALDEIFNLIPEINGSGNLKCLFSIFFAEISRHKGNILLQKMLLENALNFLFETFGDYSIVLLPLTLSLSDAYKELGLIDDCYAYLNKAFKIAYFNKDFNSLEVLEVLNEFVLFSKHINETNEEGIYSEIIGKIIQKNLMLLDKKSKNFKAENKRIKNNENENENKKKKNAINKNNAFVNFVNLPYENKLEILIEIGYLLKHVDYMSTYGKIGKNTENIINKFNYCNQLLENMEILDIDRKTLNFDVILNDLIEENLGKTMSSKNYLRLEENFIYFYLNPDLKKFIGYKAPKTIKAEESNNYENNNKNKADISQENINHNKSNK